MSTDSTARFAMLELDTAIPSHVPAEGSVPETMMSVDDVAVTDNSNRDYYNNVIGATTVEAVLATVPELGGTVSKEQLYTLDGTQVPDAFATVRKYADGRRQALGVVGARYKVVQDGEAFKIIEPLMERGIIKSLNAGAYKAKTWVYGEAGLDPIDVVPGDSIQARVLIGNSHDGSIPWCVGFPGNRVVCQNTFHFALNSKASKLLKLRHSGNVLELVEQASKAIESVGMEFIEAADKFKFLASIQCDTEDLKEYTGYVFSKWASDDEDTSALETAGQRVYNRIVEAFEDGPGSQYARGSYWNAYNAVTQYLTHERGRGTEDARFADLQWGNGANLAKRALDGALHLSTSA
jgi:phage/plasmid-like protein (TIGR03299 family)